MKKPAEAYIEHGLFEENGLGQVVVCRYKNDGSGEAGVFLVDVYCLGVKSAFFTRFDSQEEQHKILDRLFRGAVPEPEFAANGRKLVEEAVAYAKSIGFAPSSDYKKGARVFGGIQVKDATAHYTFGKDGKPYYISGPNDHSERIYAILRKRVGTSGFQCDIADESFRDFMES